MINASSGSTENQKGFSCLTYVKGTRGISVDYSKANFHISRLITQTNDGIETTPVEKALMEKDKIHSMSPGRKLHPGEKFLIPPQTGTKIGMKTLILDLDETLIHSSFQKLSCPSDFVLKIEVENNLTDIHVVKRPGVDEFLSRVAKCYEVVIFTASLAKYADPLIDLLDVEKLCSYRLFREHCTNINGLFIKELKRLNRNMKSVILLDNNPASYYLDNENGIPIKTFYDDQTDCELVQMAYVLEKLSKVSDVRPFIKEIVYMNQINYDRAYEIFHQQNKREEILNKESLQVEGNVLLERGSESTKSKEGGNEKKLKILSVEMIKSQDIPLLGSSFNTNPGGVLITNQSANMTNTHSALNEIRISKANGKVISVSNNFRNGTAVLQKQANPPEKKNKIALTNKNNISVSSNNQKTLSGSRKPSLKPNEKINPNVLKSFHTSSTQPEKQTKEESNDKRPSSVLPFKSHQFIGVKKIVKNNASGKTSTAQSTEISRNFSFASLPSNLKKQKQIEAATSSLTAQSQVIKGSNTTRFSETEAFRKNHNSSKLSNSVFTNSGNQSASPAKKILNEKIESGEEYKVRINPASARPNSDLLNFKKELNERPNSSKEKFNSLAFTKKENKLFSFASSTQHSTSNSLSKSKMPNFNTSHTSIQGKITTGHCDLKIIKIIPDKNSINRFKNGNMALKRGYMTK